MSQNGSFSKSEAMARVASQLTGPIPFDGFVERVLELWPSTAKKPQTSIRRDLRYERLNYGLAYLDSEQKTLMPLSVGLRGVRIRLAVSELEIEAGVLFFDATVSAFLPRRFQFDAAAYADVQLFDEAEQPLSAEFVSVEYEVDSLFGVQQATKYGFKLPDWFQAHDIQPGDSVLVTVEDWTVPRFRLEHEPAATRDEEAIQARNGELMDILYTMLESARNEALRDGMAIIEAHLRLADPQGYPGDPWPEAIAADGRMMWSGHDVRYAEFGDSLDWLEPDDASAAAAQTPAISQQEAQQIYRFKAALKHRKGLWRRIEIRGGQTLADFNQILMRAFGHDWDHLGGFWKRIRRGNTRRFREVDLGSVDPFGEGEGADVRIAETELEPGQDLKYVYDFGDWIEHIISLEDILPAAQDAPDADYPRIVAQNKPRYRYCIHCKEEGRKEVANWICIWCSNDEQKQVLVCGECVDKHHSDHYVSDMVY